MSRITPADVQQQGHFVSDYKLSQSQQLASTPKQLFRPFPPTPKNSMNLEAESFIPGITRRRRLALDFAV